MFARLHIAICKIIGNRWDGFAVVNWQKKAIKSPSEIPKSFAYRSMGIN
jgi:hypothetical protein